MRVCIVGGGLSGLVCSLDLARAFASTQEPLQLFLLEAGARLGGRAHTSAASAYGVDLGGAWIWPPHHDALALARDLGVELIQDAATVVCADFESRVSINFSFNSQVYFDAFISFFSVSYCPFPAERRSQSATRHAVFVSRCARTHSRDISCLAACWTNPH
jgi:glycine/D-amino acid oxidase-like deaminating enzyme